MKTSNFPPKGFDLPDPYERGEVKQSISPNQPGRIKYQGCYWPARLPQITGQITLKPGDSVIVTGRAGITLIVMPVTNCSFLDLN